MKINFGKLKIKEEAIIQMVSHELLINEAFLNKCNLGGNARIWLTKSCVMSKYYFSMVYYAPFLKKILKYFYLFF